MYQVLGVGLGVGDVVGPVRNIARWGSKREGGGRGLARGMGCLGVSLSRKVDGWCYLLDRLHIAA